MSESRQLNSPIVYTPRADLRDAVRAELKMLGATDILIPKDRDQCVELLVKHLDAMLVLDWDLGAENANVVLGAAKGHYRVETRPIFMVIPEHSAAIIAVAADYGISQLHAGPISRLGIKECLEALVSEDEATRELRDTLVKVAECRARGEWPLATTLLQELAERMPGNERIALELAENLIYSEQWEEVVKVLSPFARRDPPNVRALHLFGRALLRKGDYEAAVALLQKAKIINPLNVDRLIDLGNAFLSNDQVAEAQSEFQEAIALDPDNKDATVGASKCLLMNGEVNEALTLLKSVSGPREMASIFNTAAVLSMRGERFAKAMTLYQSALKALGTDARLAARLHFNVGLGYRRWHKLDMAIQHLERAVALDGSFGKAKVQLEVVRQLVAHAGKPAGGGKPAPSKAREFAEEELSASNRAAGVVKPAQAVGDGLADSGGGQAIIDEDDGDGEENAGGALAPIDWEPDD